MGASLNNLGVAHKSIGDFSKALAFFTKSLTIKLATGGDAAATVNNIAEVHRCLGDNTTALQYYEWAYEIRCMLWCGVQLSVPPPPTHTRRHAHRCRRPPARLRFLSGFRSFTAACD